MKLPTRPTTRAEYSQAQAPEAESVLAEEDIYKREQQSRALEKLILDHVDVLPRQRQTTANPHNVSRGREENPMQVEFCLVSGACPRTISLAPRIFMYTCVFCCILQLKDDPAVICI